MCARIIVFVRQALPGTRNYRSKRRKQSAPRSERRNDCAHVVCTDNNYLYQREITISPETDIAERIHFLLSSSFVEKRWNRRRSEYSFRPGNVWGGGYFSIKRS